MSYHGTSFCDRIGVLSMSVAATTRKWAEGILGGPSRLSIERASERTEIYLMFDHLGLKLSVRELVPLRFAKGGAATLRALAVSATVPCAGLATAI